MQTKKFSLIESISNVIVGYLVAVVSQLLVFPLFGINIPIRDNLLIGLWFTVISIIRSYTLRRLFNKIKYENNTKATYVSKRNFTRRKRG